MERCLSAGVPAEKVPLSGSLGGKYSGDLIVAGKKAEVKARKGGEGFKVLERWLANNEYLFLHRTRRPPFVAMEWETFLELLISGKVALSPEPTEESSDGHQ